MANKYPYASSPGGLIKTLEHLRRSFPKEVTADTLRKLGLAPKNESYVINVLRFLGVVDDEGKKVEAKTKAFVQHKEESFASEFEKIVREAYAELFELHTDNAWTLDKASLTQFFRTSDHSTDIVGTRQANTFTYLASMAGHGAPPAQRDAAARQTTSHSKVAKGKKVPSGGDRREKTQTGDPGRRAEQTAAKFGLTVRVEVNLPADGNQETYDRIFRSIRKNLIDGE